MTVEELIEELKKFDKNKLVSHADNDERDLPVNFVYEDNRTGDIMVSHWKNYDD